MDKALLIGVFTVLGLFTAFGAGYSQGEISAELKYAKSLEVSRKSLKELEDTSVKRIQDLTTQNKELKDVLSNIKKDPIYGQPCVDVIGVQELNNAISKSKR